MTEIFLSKELINITNETIIKIEVNYVLNDILDSIEIYHLEIETKKRIKEEKQRLKENEEYKNKINQLNNERNELEKVLEKIKKDAIDTREVFVSDIAQVLSESRNLKNLRTKLKDIQRKLHMAESYEADLIESRKRIKELEKAQWDKNSPASILSPSTSTSTSSLFLPQTQDVLRAAQVCRFVFKRVDTLFGIESQIAKDEWNIEPPDEYEIITPQTQSQSQSTSESINNHSNSNSTSIYLPTTTSSSSLSSITTTATNLSSSSSTLSSLSSSSSTTTTTTAATSTTASVPNNSNIVNAITSTPSIGLTKAMAEALLKKLSAPELKTIILMNEQQKKAAIQIEQLTTDNEDLKARLQSTENVRDFLINKLKEAEVALKSSLTDNNVIKRQSENDHEVIFFLDNKTQELEIANNELKKRCEQLQVSLELLSNSNTHKENQLLIELDLMKEKYEANETKLKSHKKILANEVKTLRQQVETLQKEKDVYLLQLQKFKEILFMGGINSNGSYNNNNSSNSMNHNLHNLHHNHNSNSHKRK